MSQNNNNYAAGFDTPLGRMILLAEDTSTENKKAASIQLIGLGFAGIKMNDEAVIADLSRQLGCHNALSNPEKLRPLATQILDQPHKAPVSLRGTDFQKKVWRRLSWKFQQALQPHMERFLIICKARRAQSVPLSAKTLFPCSFPVTGLSVQQAVCMVIDGGWILKNSYSQPRVRPFQLRFKITGL